ncbi:cytolysin-activating lysine-acyltransferase [Vibrio crassostreae]|uniref:toxin-activating lysine-acyltransferase n=1 Tax=Vibrio crassostreae TaxID=246167 RepID=UPI0010520D2A|nr:toxin-activating lysine-acyltransferase [Vibrio crassostreae]TCN90353.1 RTX toxin acyltransferase family protein [Vibrio crassostreae]CAK2537643.1 cytolysin-activating lysine-acyltransferase [Vibrio crassostreae]CAK2551096.1 cytolysin-activating lysine-acyltransferase [Vibrio crassostreae]CAK2620637.1 cytolysin-activating lysine-acyltransferase [Vibrio crassostreae]CAK3110731.1 cytolysin-activating lysine-acyltransferase [Vibrio crassostreae]
MSKASVSLVNSQISGLHYGPLSKIEVTHELGQFLEIMAKCAKRRELNLASFLHWIKPAVIHRQYKFLKLSSDIGFTGYVIWAWVDDSTLSNYMTQPRFSLKPMNWNEGGNLIVVDWFVEKNRASQLKELYKHAMSSTKISRREINICIRDEQGNIIKTNKRNVYGY